MSFHLKFSRDTSPEDRLRLTDFVEWLDGASTSEIQAWLDDQPKDALPDMVVLARDLITLEELWPASAR